MLSAFATATSISANMGIIKMLVAMHSWNHASSGHAARRGLLVRPNEAVGGGDGAVRHDVAPICGGAVLQDAAHEPVLVSEDPTETPKQPLIGVPAAVALRGEHGSQKLVVAKRRRAVGVRVDGAVESVVEQGNPCCRWRDGLEDPGVVVVGTRLMRQKLRIGHPV